MSAHAHAFDSEPDPRPPSGRALRRAARRHDTGSELTSIVAAFEPVYEQELLVEYLRLWAQAARMRRSDLFDEVDSVDVESIACISVRRLAETRRATRARTPGHLPLPERSYTGPLDAATFEAPAELTPGSTTAYRSDTLQRTACSCSDGARACTSCAGTGSLACELGTGAEPCRHCNDSGRRPCGPCGSSGEVPHDACGATGIINEYELATIEWKLAKTFTMSRKSRGMVKAAQRDWWESEDDPGDVLAELPDEVAVPLLAAWDAEAPATARREGTVSALPIYRVLFHWRGRQHTAWLLGRSLRVVVPGNAGRTRGWYVTRIATVTLAASLLLGGFAWWQGSSADETPAPTAQPGLTQSATVPTSSS